MSDLHAASSLVNFLRFGRELENDFLDAFRISAMMDSSMPTFLTRTFLD